MDVDPKLVVKIVRPLRTVSKKDSAADNIKNSVPQFIFFGTLFFVNDMAGRGILCSSALS
jgi:hypothetical protein